MKIRKYSGFTLVELMVVVVIIGILASLAIPRYISSANKVKVSEFKPVLKQIFTLQVAFREARDHYSSIGDGSEIGFVVPNTNSRRFDYLVTRPTLDASGAGNSVAIAFPNSLGVKVKYDGQNNLVSSDHGCIDPTGNFWADEHLSMISSISEGDCL